MPKPQPIEEKPVGANVVKASGIPVHCAHARLADITTLIPNPRNPNTHGDRQIALLAKIIKFQGWRSPITISKRSGFIVAGHGRLQAAQLLQVEQVPVDEQDFATEADEWAHLIADNRIAELAEIDQGGLASLLGDINLDGFDMDLTGFDAWDLAEALAGNQPEGNADAEPQIDRAAELNKEWQVNPGDLWRIGDHRLLCGDSTKAEDVGRVMGGEKATIVFTDPPYGVSIGDKNKMLNECPGGKKRNTGHGRVESNIENDSLSPAELKAMLTPVFVNVRVDAMADDCSVFVCSPQGGGLGMMMMMMMMEAGLETRHVIIWKKNHATFSMNRLDYDYQHEPILFTWLKRHKRPLRGQFKTSVWEIDKPSASGSHPTMKPVALVVEAILNHTDPADIAFDPFLGSGTTMVAAQNLGRKCCGIEISPDYCAVILERMKTAFPGIEISREKDLTPAP